MRRVLLLGAAVWLLMGGVAEARTVVTTPGPYNRWIEESRMPTVDETLDVVETPCPEGTDASSGCTRSDWQAVYFDRPLLQRLHLPARNVFWHELGHRFDYAMPERARARFMALMGWDGIGWRDHYGDATNYTPVEKFADTYKLCSLRSPRKANLRAVCRMIRRVATL